MTPTDLWETAHVQLALLIGKPIGDVHFVDDDDVDYSVPGVSQLRAPTLFSLQDTDAWRPFLEPTPAWLHFNLLSPGETDQRVVTLRRSRKSVEPGAAAPAVNVSAHEPRVLKVIP